MELRIGDRIGCGRDLYEVIGTDTGGCHGGGTLRVQTIKGSPAYAGRFCSHCAIRGIESGTWTFSPGGEDGPPVATSAPAVDWPRDGNTGPAIGSAVEIIDRASDLPGSVAIVTGYTDGGRVVLLTADGRHPIRTRDMLRAITSTDRAVLGAVVACHDVRVRALQIAYQYGTGNTVNGRMGLVERDDVIRARHDAADARQALVDACSQSVRAGQGV